MKLTLIGHDYKYAVEQIMLMLYPGELPVYAAPSDSPAPPDTLSAVVKLRMGAEYATAITDIKSADITAGGASYKGISRVRRSQLTGKLVTDRLLQKIIKLSFYKAAVQHTGSRPVWGALTGIRPGKIATKLLESGHSGAETKRRLEKEYFVSPERAALTLDTARAGLAVKEALRPGDIALYIGIPFCPTRCHYCSFVSHSVEKSMKLIPPFLEALHREIDAVAGIVRELGLSVISVYIGGGTPTTLSSEQLDALLKKLSSAFDLKNVREHTVEAGRPDTITPDKLRVFAENGVTRTSINPQSMNDAVLCAIGRRHTAEDVIRAFHEARAAGIGTVNMDLIAGLPGDTALAFHKTLEEVLTLRPENITVHTLSLKKGTRLTLEQTPLPDGQTVSLMLDDAEKQLRGAGYRPYYLYRQKFMSGGFENMGWCLPGHESLYNILIMEELSTILALGGGGVTKLVRPDDGKIERVFNKKYPYEYVEGIDGIVAGKSHIVRFYSGNG
jgi:oxygen-independent coproporphyrinogen-3 oxidase